VRADLRLQLLFPCGQGLLLPAQLLQTRRPFASFVVRLTAPVGGTLLLSAAQSGESLFPTGQTTILCLPVGFGLPCALRWSCYGRGL
jgi:hypothetical protein